MIEKIKQNNERIVVLFFIIIAVVTFSFNIKLDANDELWNFSNMYKMTNGYTIYQDINVIITPLIFYIGKIIFEIFESNYFISRMLNVLIFSMFYFLIYEILRQLEIKRYRRLFYLTLIYSLTYYIIMTGANYNILALDFCLLGILLVLKQKANWIQGIIIFLILMTKQNIGVYYTIGYIIYEVIRNKHIKEAIKSIFKTGMISTILVACYFIYLLINQNLYNFLNYTFLGISEFGAKNFGYNESIYTLITIILIYPVILWILKSNKIQIETLVKKQSYILMAFAIPSLFIAYPLINQHHVHFAILLSIITFIYVFEKSFLEELTSHKIIEKIIKTIIGIYAVGLILLCFYENTAYYIAMKNYNYYDMYFGAVIDDTLKKDIDEIVTYIQKTEAEGKQVKIISYYANLYMNVLGKNNGKMDLPFYGNLGREGEDGLIQEITELKNTNVLILKEEDKVFQESKKIREFIMTNYEQIGEIGRFLIYKVGY